MDLGSLFQQVTGLLNNQTRQNDSVDTDGIIGQVAGLFKGHADQTGQQFPDEYSNQQGYGNILPASQDPLGDAGDEQGGGGNILPASQDPYGDPADQR